MLKLPGKYLFFHGSIVILAGLIGGFPMWIAIIQKKMGDTYRPDHRPFDLLQLEDDR